MKKHFIEENIHKKTFDIISHRENVNYDDDEYDSHLIIQQSKDTTGR